MDFFLFILKSDILTDRGEVFSVLTSNFKSNQINQANRSTKRRQKGFPCDFFNQTVTAQSIPGRFVVKETQIVL